VGGFTGRKSSVADDDDDFIAPSDSDMELKSTSSRSRSRASSSVSCSSHTNEELSDDSSVPTKLKSNAKPGGRPPWGKSNSGGSSTNGGTFLTAAEQRVKDTKAEKKEKEDPYAFLQEGVLKDVCLRHQFSQNLSLFASILKRSDVRV
jgi:DNA mismatch repair protein MSH6